MYFADLSTPTFVPAHSYTWKNVGWLSARHPFPQAIPNDAMLNRLWQLCKVRVEPTRGIHLCEFCLSPMFDFFRDGEELRLGSAEILVIGQTGQLYAAPNLVYHYVQAHHYAPPSEFIEAVFQGPRPDSFVYAARLNRIGVAWKSPFEYS